MAAEHLLQNLEQPSSGLQHVAQTTKKSTVL